MAFLYELRVEASPELFEEWATLSGLYEAAGRIEDATGALDRAMVALPQMRSTLSCWQSNLRAGRLRQEGC
jgi:cytochrome c-type biogenesis protein CcmH/NrfG